MSFIFIHVYVRIQRIMNMATNDAYIHIYIYINTMSNAYKGNIYDIPVVITILVDVCQLSTCHV